MPQKYWAVAVPTYLSVLFVTFVFLIYPSLGLAAAPEEEEVAHSGGKEERVEPGWDEMKEVIPPIDEAPLSEVNSWTKDANKTK